MSTARRYAPVAAFDLAAAGGRIVGHAAPAGGPLPCLLRLEADGETIALARAGRHAPGISVRAGWCGVSLPGLPDAAALADRCAVRCAVSGRLLLEMATDHSAEAMPAASPRDLIDRARADDACDDPAHILPFAIATYQRGGHGALLEAAFRTLQGRRPDAAVVDAWGREGPPDPPTAGLSMILTSKEYRARPLRFIPGPFHPAFAFDLSPLG